METKILISEFNILNAKEAKEEYNCKNVVISGCSHGTRELAILVHDYPEEFDGIISISGSNWGAYEGSSYDIIPTIQENNIPTVIINGTQDTGKKTGWEKGIPSFSGLFTKEDFSKNNINKTTRKLASEKQEETKIKKDYLTKVKGVYKEGQNMIIWADQPHAKTQLVMQDRNIWEWVEEIPKN